MNTLTIITTAVQPSAGIWELINDQMAQAKAALIVAAAIAAVVIVLGTAVKTKSILPTILAAVVGAGLIFFASGGLELFSGQIGETVKASSVHELVLPVFHTDISA